MEQIILQQRIEERAKQRLLKDLLTASNHEYGIINIVGDENYKRTIMVRELFGKYEKGIKIEGEATQALFDKLLPRYIVKITDEILGQIDQIEYLLQNKDLQEQEY